MDLQLLSNVFSYYPFGATLIISYIILRVLIGNSNIWRRWDDQDKNISYFLVSILIYLQSIMWVTSIKNFLFFFNHEYPKKYGMPVPSLVDATDYALILYPILICILFISAWAEKKKPLYKQEKLLYEIFGLTVIISLFFVMSLILFYLPFLLDDFYKEFTLKISYVTIIPILAFVYSQITFLLLILRILTKSLDCDNSITKFLKNFKEIGLSPYITWIKSNKKLTFSIVVVCVFILFLLMTPKNVTPQVSLSDKELYEVSIKGQFNHDGKYSSEQFCRTLSISNEIRQNINVTPPRFKIVGWLVVHTDLGEAKLIQKPDYVKIEKTKNGKNYLLFNLSAMDKPYRSTLNGFEKGYDCSNNIIDRKVRKLIDDYDLGLYSYTANLTFSCANIRNDHAFLSIPIKEEDFSLYVHLQEILISPIKNCTVEWYDYNPKSKGDYVDVKTLGARKVYINIAKRCENNESITVTYEVICSRNTSR